MKDKEFLEIHNVILEKVSNIIKIKFSNRLIYNKEYLKAEKNLITKKSTRKNAVDIFIYQSY